MMFKKTLIFTILTCLALGASAQSSKELKRKKEALQRDIELAQRNLAKATSGKKLTQGQIAAIQAQIRLRQEKISTINSEIKNLDHQITENTGKVKNLKGRLSDLKKEYAGMIRFAQRNRNAYDKMMFIFAANDFNQAYKRIKYLQQFGQYRKKQAGYIENTQQQLSSQIVVLDKNLKSKSSLLKEEVTEKSKLDKNKNEQASVLSKLSKQEKQYQQDLKKKRQQQIAVDREISRAISREIAAARKKAEEEERERERIAAAKAKAENKPVATTSPSTSSPAKSMTNNEALRATPEAAKLSDAFEANRGSLPSPVANGYITLKFGPYKVDQATDFRNGVVFQTSEGAAARAVFNGTVLAVFPQYGKVYVMISHGSYYTVYGGLRSANVKKGDKVTTKQTIGVVGVEDGISVLDFQIRRGETPQNPESWLAR